jgi:hypothetical protein
MRGQPARLEQPTTQPIEGDAAVPPGWKASEDGTAIARTFHFERRESLAMFVFGVMTFITFREIEHTLVIGRSQVAVTLRSPDSGGLPDYVLDFAEGANCCARSAAPEIYRADGTAIDLYVEGRPADLAAPEQMAQGRLASVLERLKGMRSELVMIRDWIPAPDDQEAMEEGREPHTLGSYLRTGIEGALIDDLSGFIESIEKLVTATPRAIEQRFRIDQGMWARVLRRAEAHPAFAQSRTSQPPVSRPGSWGAAGTLDQG